MQLLEYMWVESPLTICNCFHWTVARIYVDWGSTWFQYAIEFPDVRCMEDTSWQAFIPVLCRFEMGRYLMWMRQYVLSLYYVVLRCDGTWCGSNCIRQDGSIMYPPTRIWQFRDSPRTFYVFRVLRICFVTVPSNLVPCSRPGARPGLAVKRPLTTRCGERKVHRITVYWGVICGLIWDMWRNRHRSVVWSISLIFISI